MVEYWIWKWKPPNLNILKVAQGTSFRDREMIFLTEPSRKCSTEEIGELCESSRNLYRIIPRLHITFILRRSSEIVSSEQIFSSLIDLRLAAEETQMLSRHCNQSPSLLTDDKRLIMSLTLVMRHSGPPSHICKHLKSTWHLHPY